MKKLSIDQHRLTATDLFDGYLYALRLSVVVANTYGKTGRAARAAEAVAKQIARLRSELDSQLARDWPEEFSPSIYFPGTGAETQG